MSADTTPPLAPLPLCNAPPFAWERQRAEAAEKRIAELEAENARLERELKIERLNVRSLSAVHAARHNAQATADDPPDFQQAIKAMDTEALAAVCEALAAELTTARTHTRELEDQLQAAEGGPVVRPKVDPRTLQA
jgi:hypothetical protein